MSRAFIVCVLFSYISCVPVKAEFPLAVGGHGTIFYKPGELLASARVWIEVETPFGWANATFPNATEVILDEETGFFELEAVVGDARRRDEIKGLRLFLADSMSDVSCWYRDLDTAYMYLYKSGRRPTRPFSANFTLRGSRDEANGFDFGQDSDTCFHQRLAVNVEGTIMCNESKPMAFASIAVLVKAKNGTGWRQVLTKLDGTASMTGADGSYRHTTSPGSARDRDEIEELVLWFANGCGRVANHSRITANISLDYVYAYEQGYDYKTFTYNAQVDKWAPH